MSKLGANLIRWPRPTTVIATVMCGVLFSHFSQCANLRLARRPYSKETGGYVDGGSFLQHYQQGAALAPPGKQLPAMQQQSNVPDGQAPFNANFDRDSSSLMRKVSYGVGAASGARMGSTLMASPGAGGFGGGGAGFGGLLFGLGYGALMTKLRIGNSRARTHAAPTMHGTNPYESGFSFFVPFCCIIGLCVIGAVAAVVWATINRIKSGETEVDKFKRQYYERRDEARGLDHVENLET